MSTGPVGYVDTTLRDLAAHPWAGSISTEEIAAVAAQLANSGAVALEALDSFSARGALEGRTESPWDRLRVAVRAAKSVPVGIVVAARTLFGDRPVGADLARRFVTGACESGARAIRVIDPLNDAEALLPFAEAAVAGGAELVPTLVLGPSPDLHGRTLARRGSRDRATARGDVDLSGRSRRAPAPGRAWRNWCRVSPR